MKIKQNIRFLMGILVVFLIVGCSGGTNSNKTGNISEIDLTQYLLKEGDLPSGISAGQIRDSNADFPMPKSENTAYREFVKNGKSVGFVTVWLIKTEDDLNAGLKSILPSHDSSVEVLGEKEKIFDLKNVGEFSDDSYFMSQGVLVFKRCHALVFISMPTDPQFEGITAYAKHLDQRLKSVVCEN